MKKIEITVEETLRYDDTIVVLQPHDMSDETFEGLLSKAERKNKSAEGGAKDLAYILDEVGLKVVSHSSSFPDSPRDSDLEIFDVMEIK